MLAIADALQRDSDALVAANQADLAAARDAGLEPAMLDRLLSNPQGQLTPLRGSKLWQLAALHLWLDQQGL